MNRTIVSTLGIFCTLIVINASFTYAQENEVTASTTQERATQTNTPARQTFTAQPSLSPVAQDRLLNLAANMSNRLEGTVKRLQNVTDRLTSRLTKMEAQGVDITTARAELALAQLKLNEVTQNLANIDNEVNAFVGSATPRENWQNLKNTYVTTSTSIRAAHQNILATINLAKNAQTMPSTPNATSTATSTNN